MSKKSVPIGRLTRDQRGVTGLETAIILIAFVVVASVFAFTVLSTGIFSAEKGKETIHAGLREARSSVELKGSVIANGVADKVLSLANSAWTAKTSATSSADTTDKKEGSTSILVTLTNALGGEPVDITEPSDSDADGIADTDSIHTMIITYTDLNQVIKDLYWTKTFQGDNDGDKLIESGEKVELTALLKGLGNTTPVVKDTRFQLELRPEDGGVLVVERSMPDNIDAVMNLN